MQQQKKCRKKLVFTVSNDLNYDQRMIRICTSLCNRSYEVLLVGRKLRNSLPLQDFHYKQKRLFCFFERGKLFYIEYNIRLFFFLLFQKADLICAIDLDTILPCYFVSVLLGKKRVYDAHELFCEMKEVVTRPWIYKFWKLVEKFSVPRYPNGYTVNSPIQAIFKAEYGLNYEVVMNVPFLTEKIETSKENFIIYQGAVNQGRSFETLIPAFQWIDYPLWIYGDGNFYLQCKALITKFKLEEKVILKGKLPPAELKKVTAKALLGITLFENNGLNNYYSLGNRFFDYIQAAIPQVCVNYPAYKKINEEYEVAVLIDDLSAESIATAINSLLIDDDLRNKLENNCYVARAIYNWQNEEKKLGEFYQRIFSDE